MKRQALYFITALVFCLIGARSGYATLPMSLYDDFQGSMIDAAKWQSLEYVREIRSGKQVSIFRAAGPPGNPGNYLIFANPTSIQSFQADVRLNAYTAPPDGSSRVRLRGNYYNDGTTGPGATGDVRAQLYLRGTSSRVDIRYNVYKCTDADCNTAIDVIPTATIKSAALGEAHALAIGWDGSVFTFTVDGVSTVVDPKPVQPIANPVPNLAEKTLNTQLHIAGPGGEGYVAGDFDNVMVNGTPYDDFSGTRLDPTKWTTLEFVRQNAGGRFVSKVAWPGSPGSFHSNSLRFVNQKAVTAMRADVTVDAHESTGGFVEAWMGGRFYNAGLSTGPHDATGDVGGWIRVYSSNGGPLTADFVAFACGDPSCYTGFTFFTDQLALVNPGESHNLFVVWDGSLFTYGIDGTSRAFDPKPFAPVVKPSAQHYRDLETRAYVQTPGALPYIAATLDNLFVNDQGIAIPRLAPFLQELVAGDVTSAGVGLRGTGTGTISFTGIPAGATVQRALLYWATLGTSGTFTSPTLNGTPVSGTLIGQADEPYWGASQSYAYRADVTSLISGNGPYTVAGLPAAGPSVNDSEGASLVVIYTLPGAPTRTIIINDGAVMLTGGLLQFYATPLSGFVAANPPTGSTLTYVVGDGQSWIPEYAGLNTTLLATNEFSGTEGTFWDTKIYDVSSVIPPGSTTANAIVSTYNDALVWVAAVLSVPLETFPITVTKAGTGSGTVTSTPAGIDCGATCTASFAYGNNVTLTATPATGSAFTGWSGDCTGTGACTVTMTQARNVTATFTLQTFTLTVMKAGTGSGTVTSSPPGITCGSDCTESYPYNTSVTLTATPAVGSTFTGWSGACSGTGTCTVSMTQARSVTATFTLQTFALTVTKAGTGSGTVTSNPTGINCGSTCTATFNYGTSVTLTATPLPGSTFTGWGGDCTAATGVCTVSMTQAWSVTAIFTRQSPSLTLSVNQSAFRRAQQLTLGATVTPGATPVAADVYVALQLPDGSLLFLQGDGTFTWSLQPILRSWTIAPFAGQIFSYIFGGGEPVGNYAWLAAFAQPATLNFIGPIISAPFSFSP